MLDSLSATTAARTRLAAATAQHAGTSRRPAAGHHRRCRRRAAPVGVQPGAGRNAVPAAACPAPPRMRWSNGKTATATSVLSAGTDRRPGTTGGRMNQSDPNRGPALLDSVAGKLTTAVGAAFP